MITICTFKVSCPTDEEKRRVESHFGLREPILSDALYIPGSLECSGGLIAQLDEGGFAYQVELAV